MAANRLDMKYCERRCAAVTPVAAQYGMLLNERGIPTTVLLEAGGHDWSYWKGAMLDILAWHGARFEYDRK